MFKPLPHLLEHVVLKDGLVESTSSRLLAWLGIENPPVGIPAAEFMQTIEDKPPIPGLAQDFNTAYQRLEATGERQTSPVYRVSVAEPVARVVPLRVVLTKMMPPGRVLVTVEDLRDSETIAEQAENLVLANAKLTQEIVDHLKTENELRETQERLQQSQRLESIGRLAGGVAHDFNNLLSIIMSYSQIVSDELPHDSPVRGDVEEIRRAGERANELTRQLLAFGGQQTLMMKVVDLNQIVEQTANLVRRVLGSDVNLVINSDQYLWRAKVDPGQIEQSLVNLIINSRDAMPDGGTLTISTSNQIFDEEYALEHQGATAGPYVVLTVTDTGTGMDKATQERAFEPFFTTKPPGKGTGLGLSSVYGVVKQSGGHIVMESELGKGTTFKLCFPSQSI